jgi:hypothetical protein
MAGRGKTPSYLSRIWGGRTIEGDDELLKHATDYYKMLFGPTPGNAFPLDPNLWTSNEKVSDADNEELTKPSLKKE